MDNGVKPTRLWHLTGKKHYASLLRDRLHALPRPLSTRRSKDTLVLYAVVTAGVAAVAYSYGRMSPPRDMAKIKKLSKNPCDPPQKKKCSPSVKPGPCPLHDQGTKPQSCPECND